VYVHGDTTVAKTAEYCSGSAVCRVGKSSTTVSSAVLRKLSLSHRVSASRATGRSVPHIACNVYGTIIIVIIVIVRDAEQ